MFKTVTVVFWDHWQFLF